VREVTKTSLMMLKMSLETSRTHSWVKIMNDLIKFLVRMGQSEVEKGEISPQYLQAIVKNEEIKPLMLQIDPF
jgi:hypothetical protein